MIWYIMYIYVQISQEYLQGITVIINNSVQDNRQLLNRLFNLLYSKENDVLLTLCIFFSVSLSQLKVIETLLRHMDKLHICYSYSLSENGIKLHFLFHPSTDWITHSYWNKLSQLNFYIEQEIKIHIKPQPFYTQISRGS